MLLFRYCILSAAVVLYAVLVGISPVQAQSVEYRLGPQDKIQVTVFNEPNLSGEFEIDGEGRVALPLIGVVTVGQMTLREAERAIADKLHPDYLLHPKVSIQVTNYRPFYILGEVKQPGSYPYANGMTVMQAVALAGGFTYRARESEMVIVRGGSRGQAGPNSAVLPGDIIEIPERFF